MRRKNEAKMRKGKQRAGTRYDRLMSREIVLHNSLRDISEKAARFEASNTELEMTTTKLVIKVQKLETSVSAIQMESFRENRLIELQFNARVEVYQFRPSDQMRFPPRIFHCISKSLLL
jgi:hypothetical protein